MADIYGRDFWLLLGYGFCQVGHLLPIHHNLDTRDIPQTAYGIPSMSNQELKHNLGIMLPCSHRDKVILEIFCDVYMNENAPLIRTVSPA